MCTPDRLRRCKRRRGSAGHLVTGTPGDPSQGDSRWPHHAFAARLRNCNGGTNTATSSRWRRSLTSSPVRSWFARRATRTRRLGRRSSVFGASGGPHDERSGVYRRLGVHFRFSRWQAGFVAGARKGRIAAPALQPHIGIHRETLFEHIWPDSPLVLASQSLNTLTRWIKGQLFDALGDPRTHTGRPPREHDQPHHLPSTTNPVVEVTK